MSEELIKKITDLTKENDTLKQSLEVVKLESMSIAQMFQESINQSIQLRSRLLLIENKYNIVDKQLKECLIKEKSNQCKVENVQPLKQAT